MNQTGGEPSAPQQVITDADATISTESRPTTSTVPNTGASDPAANVRAECLPESQPASWRVEPTACGNWVIIAENIGLFVLKDYKPMADNLATLHNTQLANITAERDELSGRVAALESDLLNRLDDLEKAEEERDQLRHEYGLVFIECSELKTERDQLKEELDNLRSVTTMDLEVMRECKQLLKTEDPRDVKVELEELKSRVEWMLIIIKELRRPQPALSHIQDLRRGINELGLDNDRLRKELDEKQKAIDGTARDWADSDTQVKEIAKTVLGDSLVESDAAGFVGVIGVAEQLRDRITALETCVAQDTRAFERLDNLTHIDDGWREQRKIITNRLRQTPANVSDRIRELEKQLECALNEHQETLKEMEQEVVTNAQHEHRIVELESQLTALEKDRDKARDRIKAAMALFRESADPFDKGCTLLGYALMEGGK